jgi:hypothetical protein
MVTLTTLPLGRARVTRKMNCLERSWGEAAEIAPRELAAAPLISKGRTSREFGFGSLGALFRPIGKQLRSSYSLTMFAAICRGSEDCGPRPLFEG